MPKNSPHLSAVGHRLPANATDLQRSLYRRDILKLPGPIDRWLTTVSRATNVRFLETFLMMQDFDAEHVVCLVQVLPFKVCSRLSTYASS